MEYVICKKQIEGYGNNAMPVAQGECCDACNLTRIIPARVKQSEEAAQKAELYLKEQPVQFNKRDAEIISCYESALNANFTQEVVQQLYKEFYQNCLKNKLLNPLLADKHSVLKRCGRYAIVDRGEKFKSSRYVVACGYDEKTGEWNQGYYFMEKTNAEAEFAELSGYACAKCKHVDAGCVVCKI